MSSQIKKNRMLLTDFILEKQQDFYRFAFSYVKSREAALDVVQDSIVKALSSIDTLRDPSRIKPWFYRILANESVNAYRRVHRFAPLDEIPEPAAPPVRADETLDLYDALARLAPNARVIVQLRFFEDMKLEEIAQATGQNLNTVKSRLYQSLRQLKEWTREDFIHEPLI